MVIFELHFIMLHSLAWWPFSYKCNNFPSIIRRNLLICNHSFSDYMELCWFWLYSIFLQLTINVHTLIYYEHIKGFITFFFVVTFRQLVILFFKKEPLFWFWYFQQPSHLSLFFKKYAIHTHYTQCFSNFNWNFKQVTSTWNQFIFQFWNLLFWN
jgi:hypothetical protein